MLMPQMAQIVLTSLYPRPPTILEILGENTIAMVLGIPHLVLPSKDLNISTLFIAESL